MRLVMVIRVGDRLSRHRKQSTNCCNRNRIDQARAIYKQTLNAAMAEQRIGEAIEAVAHDSVDALNASGGEGFDHLVCNSACHDILLKIGCMVSMAIVGAAHRPR